MSPYIRMNERKQKNKITTSFSINDVPVSLYREFISDITQYNDCYWVKLQDLMRKSEAYDTFVQLGMLPNFQEQDNPKEDKDDDEEDEILTMGGLRNRRK